MGVYLALSGCASKNLNYDEIQPLEKNVEFEKMVQVKEIAAAAQVPEPTQTLPRAAAPALKARPLLQPAKKKVAKKSVKEAPAMSKKREASIEDTENFTGRRPNVDPFVVGEKVTLAMTYFNVSAGHMTLETRPFVEVNGRKSYHFYLTVKSSKMFNMIYSVDDWAETFVDFEEMVPYTLGIDVKESKQLKDIRSFFDWKTMTGQYWETKLTADDGKKTRKKIWNILPFSQNVLSAAFYMRTFTYKPNKELAFRVADDGTNLVFTGKVLRFERLKTDVGEFDTIVVQPKITVDGMFKQMGEIFIWLTNDERKHIVRIESKIKIGTVVAKLKSIEYLR